MSPLPAATRPLRPSLTAFGAALRNHRESCRISQSRLGRMAGFDHSFVSRLESGSRDPSREAVELLAMAMRLSAPDVDALLMAAGYMPESTMSLLDREPSAARLYTFLAESKASERVKDLVREQVLLIVEQVEALAPKHDERQTA